MRLAGQGQGFPVDDEAFLVFDLDDTLYPERTYARSALAAAGSEMARRFSIPDPSPDLICAFDNGEADAIGVSLGRYGLPAAAKSELLSIMHDHRPEIQLRDDARRLIEGLRRSGRGYAILTDGRATTQRRKIAALGCEDATFISISEECGWTKSDSRRWMALEAAVSGDHFCYVGDNPAKDFLLPNLLGWDTVMLKSGGDNVHTQVLPADARYHPRRTVISLDELL